MAAQHLSLPSLYAILDPEQARGRSIEEALDELLRAGIKILQLRAKAMPARDFLDLARTVRQRTLAHGCRFIVNDRADVALACDADGVHLGQDDLPLHAARRLLPTKIIGISTHDRSQAKQAEEGGADYIGFGPIYGTATKETGYSARGPAMLRELRGIVAIPIVAIGGINEGNVSEVWAAGADSAAIISDILGAEHITTKVQRILARHSGK
jgi:thiamine-phosphate pyrophosphorylase